MTFYAIKSQAESLEERLTLVAKKLGIVPPDSPEHSDAVSDSLRDSLDDTRTQMTVVFLLAFGSVFLFRRMDEVMYEQAPDAFWNMLCTSHFAAGALLVDSPTGPSPESLTAIFSSFGKAGADVRHMPIRRLQSWTLSLYKEGTWPSANKAAHALKNQVIEHGKTIGVRLSEENAQRTIAEWIRKSV
jgi:hypothetical protein